MRGMIRSLGTFIAIAGGVLGLALSLLVLYEDFGNKGVLWGFVLFPFVFAYFPIYTLLVYDSWNLVLLNYGTLAMSWFLISMTDHGETSSRSAIDEPPTKPVVTQESPAFTVMLLLICGLLLMAVISTLTGS